MPDLSGFDGLITITAQNNRMSGPLFDLSGLIGLQYLQLQNNFFTGSIPGEVSLSGPGSLLVDFTVQNNMFTGSLPSNMDTFTALKRFRVEGNNLTSLVPKLPSTITKIGLDGLGNQWLCPFPVDGNTLIGKEVDTLNCTCPEGSSCNEVIYAFTNSILIPSYEVF